MMAEMIKACLKVLEDGKPALVVKPSKTEPEKVRIYNMLQLLTSKPVLYVCNVDEGSCADGNEFSKKVFERAKVEGNVATVISAKIEQEIAALSDDEEKKEFEKKSLRLEITSAEVLLTEANFPKLTYKYLE